MKKNLPVTIYQYTIRVLIFELGLVVIAGGILFLIEHSLNSFGDWMFWAGLIILVSGASSLLGGWGITRSGTYQIAQTVGEQDISTRTKTELKEDQSNFSFMLLSVGIGILAIIISGLA